MKSTYNVFGEQLNLFKNDLIKKVTLCDVVYITPHKKMDFDALASSALLCELLSSFGKTCYIVTNDLESMMEENLKSMYDSLKNKYCFINTEQLDLVRNIYNKELLLVVDANKEYLVPVSDKLSTFNEISVIDHHNTDEHTIATDSYFINQEISSASEMVYLLYKSFGLEINKELAQHLLTGIYLDTGVLTRNFKRNTALVVSDLMLAGADPSQTLDMFVISDFASDRQRENEINRLIDSAVLKEYGNCNFAIAFDKTRLDKIYSHEVLAQTADRLLKYKFDASFVIGFTDLAILGEGHENVVAIKGRSKGKFDISDLMHQFGGGGTMCSGACEIKSTDIMEIRQVVFDMLKFMQNIKPAENVKTIVYTNKSIKKAN